MKRNIRGDEVDETGLGITLLVLGERPSSLRQVCLEGDGYIANPLSSLATHPFILTLKTLDPAQTIFS